jgi:LmbE family N-acetylglucosaminyl deacetylase
MERACQKLGVELAFCEVEGVRDGLDQLWDTDRIEEAVAPLLADCAAVFTFDRGGVSGHPNHSALSKLFASKAVPAT